MIYRQEENIDQHLPLRQPAAANADNAPPSEQPPAFNPRLPAWEQPGSWLGAFARTTRQVLLQPFVTFQEKAYPGAASLIAFALPWVVLASCITLLQNSGQLKFSLPALLSVFIGCCLYFVAGLLLLHVALIVVRADKNGLKATFRASAYLCCSALWLLVPWVGRLLSLVWCLAIVFSVLAASQAASRRRILGALLVLLAILLVLTLIVVIFAGIAIFSQMMVLLQQTVNIPFIWK